jgi:pyruvate formate lyase activating enzyme
LTLTGGEPVLQPDLAEALLRLAKAECISTAIETSGYASWKVWERLVPYLDTILYDIKHIDARFHRAGTGVDNTLILDNLKRLTRLGVPLTVRVPLIPGFNADRETILQIGEYIVQLEPPANRLDLLPYHTLGRGKYTALAIPYPWNGHEKLDEREVESWANDLRQMGLTVTIGG